MASAKLLLVLVCALTFAASGSAQNITNPSPNITLPNATAPVIVNPLANATLPPVLNTTAGPSNVSNATLAIYRAVRSQSLALLGALGTSDVTGVLRYVTPDVQLFLPSTPGPVLLNNTATLLSFYQNLTPPAGANTSISNVSELYFYVVDNTNVAIVDEMNAGQLGNVYITAFWSLINTTSSPLNGSWLMNYATITPAPAAPYVPQPTPFFVVTPNITLVPSLNTSTINVNGTNRTATLLNSTLPANLTIESQVIDASNALQAALSNTSVSLANITSQFAASWFQIVLPLTKSPTPLNLTNPTIVNFFNLLSTRNSSGTATPQTAVSYRQLNTQAAVLTTLVPAVPGVGDVYVTQLWQYLNASSGSNTTTGVNTTVPVNSTSAPLAKSWQLTLAAVNLAPAPGASAPGGAPAPAPALAPSTVTTGVTTPTPSASGSDTPVPTPSTSAPTTGSPSGVPTPSST